MPALRKNARLLAFLLPLFALLFRLSADLGEAPRYVDSPVYPRVNDWLESAECSRLHRNFLVVCKMDEQGRYLAAEAASLGDDRGHNLAGNIVSWFKSGPVTKLTFVKINMWLNVFGLIMLALALAGPFPLASAGLLLAGAWVGINSDFMSADVSGAFMGICALALAPVVWWGTSVNNPCMPLRRWLPLSIFWGFLLGIALLFREPIGRTGEVAALVLALCLAAGIALRPNRASRASHAKKLGLMLLIVFCFHFSSNAIIALRNALFSVAPHKFTISHGVSHNLYLGLGTIPNSLGIVYEDSYAQKMALAEDPAADYLSELHYRIMWRLYFRALKENPAEIARIYRAKISAVAGVEFRALGKLSRAIFISLFFFALVYRFVRPFPWEMAAGLYAFLCIFLLQGVLTRPNIFFLWGAQLVALVLILIPAEILCAAIRRWSRHGRTARPIKPA